jgi:Diacylglycerol acyltransferase
MDAWQVLMQGRNYILAAQPHGFLSMCGICSAVKAEKEFRGIVPTGVAEPVLRSPIMKHAMGIFNLILASKSSLKKHLQKGGVEGTVIKYAGGIAETFLSSHEDEVL